MVLYPRSGSTVHRTSFIFLVSSLVLVPPDSYCLDVRNKTKQNITEDDRYCIYYFYGWLFLAFKNLQLVWEITFGCSCELWVAPKWKMFCQKGSLCRWILKGSVCLYPYYYGTGLQAASPNCYRERVHTLSMHRARYSLRGGKMDGFRAHKACSWEGRCPGRQIMEKAYLKIDLKTFPPRLLND